MKKKNITAIVKELNVRMKKEPITLRYIHILVSVVFFSSAASLLFLLALYFNQQFQTSLFLVKDLSYNPLTSLLPPPPPPPRAPAMKWRMKSWCSEQRWRHVEWWWMRLIIQRLGRQKIFVRGSEKKSKI